MHIDRLLFGAQTPLSRSIAAVPFFSLATATTIAFDSCLSAKNFTGTQRYFYLLYEKGREKGRLAGWLGRGHGTRVEQECDRRWSRLAHLS